MVAEHATIHQMNNKQQKILEVIFSDPIDGNIEWKRIEALLKSLGCRVIEGNGSAVLFERDGVRAHFHRPHPQKAALRYRVKVVRNFLIEIGLTP